MMKKNEMMQRHKNSLVTAIPKMHLHWKRYTWTQHELGKDDNVSNKCTAEKLNNDEGIKSDF